MAFGYGTHRVIFRSVFGAAATFLPRGAANAKGSARCRCSNPFSVSAGNLIPPVSLSRPSANDF